MDIFEMMEHVVRKNGSDLHIGVGRAPVVRVHGHLYPIPDLPPLAPEDTERLIRQFAPERALKEIEEVGTSDFGYPFQDKARFRVSIFRQKGFWGAAMRLIPTRLMSFEEIGLPESVKNLLGRPRGLILVTGPTGSGKTTTLATMVDHINSTMDKHIVTIEDPIEFYHEHKLSQVTQREIGVDVPTFAEAMRRVLRMDPDVIMLGEMRDLETTSAAITAAETGHLVLGTLHTTGSARTVDRIIDQYPTDQQEQIRSQLSVSILAVISQVLMPRTDKEGLVAAFEIMIMTPAVENHIRKGETFKIPSVIQTGKKEGMILLDDFLHSLYRAGKIDRATAMDKCQDPRAMALKLGGVS